MNKNAVATLQLVERGKLSLDDTLGKNFVAENIYKVAGMTKLVLKPERQLGLRLRGADLGQGDRIVRGQPTSV